MINDDDDEYDVVMYRGQKTAKTRARRSLDITSPQPKRRRRHSLTTADSVRFSDPTVTNSNAVNLASVPGNDAHVAGVSVLENLAAGMKTQRSAATAITGISESGITTGTVTGCRTWYLLKIQSIDLPEFT